MSLIHKPILAQFIEQRLGNDANVFTLLKTMLIRSFGANTFREFWRYCNPVYGYYLLFYCYAPLRRFLPGPFCVILTFACSGFFLHDLPFGWWIRALKSQTLPMPFVAVWFAILGLLVVITDMLHMSLSRQSIVVRAGVNIGYIVLPFLFILVLSGGIFG